MLPILYENAWLTMVDGETKDKGILRTATPNSGGLLQWGHGSVSQLQHKAFAAFVANGERLPVLGQFDGGDMAILNIAFKLVVDHCLIYQLTPQFFIGICVKMAYVCHFDALVACCRRMIYTKQASKAIASLTRHCPMQMHECTKLTKGTKGKTYDDN